ncbi:S1C family serine protease [Mariniblastus fucicola]|uniref:Periplasmic serine endoprotease DegP n=1 Tax=Mariniblastus fucicola TaxID=980251 RepID=A0A5B9PQ09_9BACT|nr:trypsin-like peptidase domain-containing protein [Mariniblastus fucicola]QEG24561.1 Periplasmic serine endoprotease DegP precursor [Mariniblastus fucicola]
MRDPQIAIHSQNVDLLNRKQTIVPKFLLCLAAAMGSTFAGFNMADAQTPTQATLTSRTEPVPSRESMYKDLESQAASLEKHYRHVKRIVRTVQPTVAHIEAKKRQSANSSGKSSGSDQRVVVIEEAGAGVVIQYRGRTYVITNYHVIESSGISDIRIESDGIVYYPTRAMHDRATDLSVLEVDKRGLTPAKLGDSRQTEIGDFVVAVGSPFGLSHSVSYGIVSALHRHDLELGPQGVKYQDFMQTDAAINPGNSGGPLMNIRGEVVGINTAIASNSGGNDGIGFSIPINMVMRIVSDLIDFGEVKRGFLGVSLDARYGAERAKQLGLDRSYGALITSITPNSPAAVSNLQVGDVVLEYNNRRIHNDSHLVTRVSLSTIGEEVPLRVFRRGNFQTITVKITDRSQFKR